MPRADRYNWVESKRISKLADDDPRHGRSSGYQTHACRCAKCRDWKRSVSYGHTPATIAKRRYQRYGLTEETYLELWRAQGECCASCEADDPGTASGWHIDHDHITGNVRGILCHGCNVAFGQLRDSLARVEALARYARKHLA